MRVCCLLLHRSAACATSRASCWCAVGRCALVHAHLLQVFSKHLRNKCACSCSHSAAVTDARVLFASAQVGSVRHEPCELLVRCGSLRSRPCPSPSSVLQASSQQMCVFMLS